MFFLAFFLDFFEIAFIVVPLLAPVAQKMGIDLVWFGVLLCVTMQTSFMHPPFGFALFYLRGIASKEVKSSDIYWGALPWVGLQLVMAVVVIVWPGLVTEFLAKPNGVDPSKVEIQLEAPQDENTPVENDNPFAVPSDGSEKKAEPEEEDPAAAIARALKGGR